MAINPSKLLPTSALAIRGKEKTVATKPKKSQTLEGQVLIIKTQVIKVEKLITSSYALKYKQQKEEEKERLKTKREKNEEELEEKKVLKEESKGKFPGLPRLGFLDRIKNFIGSMILAFFVVRLIDHLPKLVPFAKALGTAVDFLIDVSGKLLDGFVTFIDWGYKAYDATRGFVKNLFGEDGAKQFDQLSCLLNKFLNLAIVAGMIAATSGGGKGVGTSSARTRPGQGGRPKVTTSGGSGVGRPDIRNPLRQRPTVTTGSGGKPKFRLPGAGPKVTGSGAKGILSSVRPFLKRIPLPIIGALIDFGLSVALGENPGRAAFRAIGAGLLGVIGAAAGSVVPVAGNFIGGLVGGFAGDAIGGALYDMFFGGKFPSQKGKTTKKEGGGITRGGKKQGAIRRTGGISPKSKVKRKTRFAQKPKEVDFEKPGADIGGRDKIFGLFPNPLKSAQKVVDAINPFKAVENAGKTLGKSDYFGPILAISSKITLGQKPTQQDYQKVGMGINLLFTEGMNKGEIVGGVAAAYAEGGIVDKKTLDAITEKGDITNWVAASFKEATETNAQKTLREIRENAGRKKQETPSEESDPTLPLDDTIPSGATSGQWGPLLDLIASVESGNSYEALNPSTTLPGATKMTISRVASEAEKIGRSKGGTGAVGRYQQLPWYLVSRAKAAGLNPDKDLFSPENQDLIVSKVNIEGNRSGRRWLKGEISDDQFMQGLSQEFAAIPNAQGVFYYKRQKSSMTPQKVKEALGKVKKGGYSQKELSRPENFKMGKGYGSGGQKIAGDLGDFMKSNKSKIPVTGSIHRHPRHLPWEKSGHSVGSLHYQGRAIDLGGWAPSNRNSGGRDEQAPVIKSILDWNKRNGYTPVQLIHHSPKYKNVGSYQLDHNDHVHVAYEKGGFTKNGPHLAMIGEKGKEFVIDADSTASIEGTFPGFLDAINKAKYDDAIQVLQNFATYESEAPQTVIIQDNPFEIMEQEPMVAGGSGMIGGGDSYDPFAMLDRLPG